MSKFVLIIVLLSSFLYSALPPRVQKLRDLGMMQENLKLQEKSSLVIEGVVIKKVEINSKKYKNSRKSYNKKIILTVKTLKVIRNKHNIEVKEYINISYPVLMANGMVGPKVFNIMVAKKNESYIFYVNDDYILSAKNYSIDTIKNDLRYKALRNKKYFRPDISFDTLECK
jgi:hypothetical protein